MNQSLTLKKRFPILLASCLLLQPAFSNALFAETKSSSQQPQKITVTGTRSSTAGETLPGVNVSEKGTTNGVISGVQGKFSISISENATLVFSMLGFTAKEVQLKGQQV